jgi:hypothetical protein
MKLAPITSARLAPAAVALAMMARLSAKVRR